MYTVVVQKAKHSFGKARTDLSLANDCNLNNKYLCKRNYKKVLSQFKSSQNEKIFK